MLNAALTFHLIFIANRTLLTEHSKHAKKQLWPCIHKATTASLHLLTS